MRTSILSNAVLCALLLDIQRGVPALADGCPAPGFVMTGTFGAGTLPAFVTVADFDIDGRIDVAVANEFSANVSVLLGNGDGTFEAAVHYATEASPSAIAVGDFNRDGKPDLAVANAGSASVSVLLGNGDGTFGARVSYPVGEIPRSVAVGDFDGDGNPDLAVANRASADVSVLRGDGDGAFQAAANYLVGVDPVSLVAADFNGDNSLDLVAANAALFDEPPNVSALLNRGNGIFRNAVNYDAGISPRSVGVGDFNHDGRPDLAVANYGGFVGSQFTNSSVSVLMGKADGSFQAPVSYVAGEGPISVVVADLNGDGRSDLAVANNRSRNVSVLFGNGNGTFAGAAHYGAGAGPQSVAAGDFNGDGMPDLVVADSGAGNVLVLLSTCVIADLSITQIDTPDPVAVGNTLTYTLSIRNNGPDAAPDAKLTDRLPTGLTFVSVTTSQGSCTNNSGTINCSLGNLSNGAQATVTLTVFPTTAGSIANTATVTSAVRADSIQGNNSASVVTTVLPVVSVTATDAGASEAGLNPGQFTVRRTGGTVGPLTVNYVVGGSATAGADYAALSGSVTIPNGSSFATVTVTPVNDPVPEPSETVTLNLSASGTYSVASANTSATVTILDDDVYLLSINDVVVTEGNGGTVNAVFTVGMSPAANLTVTVNFATADGGARVGTDYMETNGILTFPPGTVSRTITVQVLGDSLNESNEVFFVNLSNPTIAQLSDSQGTGTINNDDPVPVLSISDLALSEGNNGARDAVFTLSLSAPSGRTVGVNYSTGNGTASAGDDYLTTNGVVSFGPGTTTQAVTVKIVGERLYELDETFFLNLSNAVNATLADSQAVGTILNDEPLPGISIDDGTLNEGHTGTTNAVFTVSLSGPSSLAISVNFATGDGSARAGIDYVGTNGTVSFAPGTTNESFTVKVLGDLFHELDESFVVDLSTPANATLADPQGVGTINNDDPLPRLSMNDVSVTELGGGTTNAVFVVTLSAASLDTVTVDYATADGTAAAGVDYVATNGSLSFAPGTTNQTITVVVLDDFLNEANETFFVDLSNPTNSLTADSQGRGTINNDDPLPSLSIDDVTVTEGDGGTTNMIFAVTLSAVSGQTVLINYSTTAGTSSAGSDFVMTNGLLTFAPGTTTRTIAVIVRGDLLNEINETFLVNLSSAINVTVADGQGLGTINDDDPQPGLSVNDVLVIEGNPGTAHAVFTLSLSAASGRAVSVSYATADGTAIAGSDYVSTNGVVTFEPGATTQFIAVRTIDDALNEAGETFFVNLISPINATLNDSQGLGTISNDDPLPALSINDVVVAEGNSGITDAVFTVSLSAVSGQVVTVNYASAVGTATAGSDYATTNDLLTFAPGTTTRSVAVKVTGDLLNELDETFFVNLSGAANASVSDSQGRGTISNDDPLPAISIGNVTVIEGNTGTTDAVFAVSLSSASGRTVTVDYATAGATAVPGADFISTNGTLTFAAGTTTQTITVKANGDVVNEANDTFLVTLSNPVNALPVNSQGMGTINNDDPLPALSINDVIVTEGNNGTISALFMVRLSAISDQTATVNVTTAAGMATAGSDYLSTNLTVTFAPGMTNQAVAVAVMGDLLNESNETFFVNLTSPGNATIGDSQGVGTIGNDDPLVSIVINDTAVFEGNSGSTNADFSVRLSAPSGQLVMVNYATDHGTTVGNDYANTSGTLSFSPGQTNRFISVPVSGDTRNENNETFFVNLSLPVNATLADSQATGTILNDEGVPSISISDVSVVEGNTGTTNAVFAVRLSAAYGQVVTVGYTTADATAMAGADYAATNGVVSFAPGATNQSITVSVFGDRLNESNETFFVNLSSSINALISDGQGMATILDNDPINILLSTNSISVPEGGTNYFAVRLVVAPPDNVTVTIGRTSGSASLNVISGTTFTFTPGNFNVPQTVAIKASDDVDMTDDSATFTVSAPGLTAQTVSATALDDDLQKLTRCVGDSAAFSTTPSGTGPFSYRWSKDSTSLTGQTNSSLVLTNLMAGDAGTYRVEVSGSSYSVTKTGMLAVNGATSTTPLSSLTNCPGTKAIFSTVAGGTGPFSFVWRRNGSVLTGQTNSSLEITSFQQTNTGTYSVEVTGQCGSAIAGATLTLADSGSCQLRITAVRLAGTDVIISFTTLFNEQYRLERTADLGGDRWETVFDAVPGTGGTVQVADVGGAGVGPASRFYRVVRLPDTVPPNP